MTCSSSSSRVARYAGAIVFPGEPIYLEHDYRWVVLLKDCNRYEVFKVKYNICTSKFDAFRVTRKQLRNLSAVLIIEDALTERKFTIDPFSRELWQLNPLGHSKKDKHNHHHNSHKGCGCREYCVISIDRDKLESAPCDQQNYCRPCGRPSSGCGC